MFRQVTWGLVRMGPCQYCRKVVKGSHPLTMQRLTGSALLNHIASHWDRPVRETVISAGYGREDHRVPAFTDFYVQKMKANVQKQYKEETKQKIIDRILSAVESKTSFKSGHVQVTYREMDDKSFVYYYGIPIAVVTDGNVAIGYFHQPTVTCKRYLNAIARYFTGNKVTQRNYVWWVGTAADEKVFTGKEYETLNRI